MTNNPTSKRPDQETHEEDVDSSKRTFLFGIRDRVEPVINPAVSAVQDLHEDQRGEVKLNRRQLMGGVGALTVAGILGGGLALAPESAEVLSIEEYVRHWYGISGVQPTDEQVQKKVEMAEQLLRNVDLEHSPDHVYDRHIRTYYKKEYVDRIQSMFPDLIHLLDEPLRPVRMVDGSPLLDTQKDLTIFLRKSLAEMVTEKNREMFQDTGHQLSVTNAWRPHQQQAAAYVIIKGTSEFTSKGGACARPGNSYHQIGLAMDVSNWPVAAPYLAELGMVGGCSTKIVDDQGHCSLGEMTEASTISQWGCQINPDIGDWTLKAGKLWRRITK
ncbi:D-alanyl-D-alanine carboxypeptidase family protein [Patescibacteria group bacterium]|nr:D-alanyl-D-alanine carboxypeptidase family protein [Patescibacteria group bacterium]MBU1683608.1 D-alanyl-D-alanine carboxypeptidase family protein [Patescibacteria group bacterium]